MEPTSTEFQRHPQEVNLLDYVLILWRWKKFILINLVATAVLIAGITLLIPDRYKSTARLLPPKDRGGSLPGNISQLARDFLPSLGSLGRLGMSQDSYNYLAILQSYTAMDSLIVKFNLAEVYDVTPRTSIEKTIKAIEDYLEFKIEDDGTITVTVWDRDPQRAAEMASYLVDLLNEISIRLGTKEATDNRLFIEKRYFKVLEDLRSAEDSMKSFQSRYGIYSLQDAVSGKSLATFMPLKRVPEVTMEYLRLYRDLEIQNKLLQFALPVYEQAKIDEQKDVPVVLMLDKPVPGERKDTPKRMLIVGACSVLVLILLSVFVFFLEALEARSKRLGELESKVQSIADKIKKTYKMKS